MFLVISGSIVTSFAQGPGGRGGGSGIKAQWKSLYDLKKVCKFHVVTLGMPHFSEIGYWIADLPANYFGKNSAPSQAVLIAYSHRGKNGGPLLIFETEPQKGLAPAQLINRIAADRIFKAQPHGDTYTIKPMVAGGIVVGPSSNVPAAVDDAIAVLKH